MTLNARAWLALAIVVGVKCALLFGTAGTTQYWQASVYVAIFLGASVLTTLYLMRSDRALLARRMRSGPMFEKEGTQRATIVFTSLGFIALLIVPALDHRFGWSDVPVWAGVLVDVLGAFGFSLIFVVYRENSFRAATVDVAAGQRVITTGPYAVVRHPMYASGSLYMLGTPIAKYLTVDVERDNGSGRHFYERAGFAEPRELTRDVQGYDLALVEYRRPILAMASP